MNHLLAVPVVLPALVGAVLLLAGGAPTARTRTVGLAATAALLAVAVLLLAQTGGAPDPQVYALGDWPAPFGIVLVLDRLSALLLALTAITALAALACAVQGWDARGRHFHALFQFQLMGLNGAFLTGDLFNLFVFFECLLIASYCLLLHGLGAPRLRAAIHYVAVNLAASAVFLVAVSLLYAVTGTLNLAHLAERLDGLAADELALARAAGLLLLGVFSIKAALFPLYFWLPDAYASASAPVAALFSIMTKVGVYAIVRVFTVVFGDDDGAIAAFARPWLLPAALATLALAALGALGAKRLSGLVAYLTAASAGTMLVAVSGAGMAGLSAALFYLAHSTFAVAAMFLIADLVSRQRGSLGDSLGPGPVLRQPAALGLAFLLGAATLAGMPPSSGFIGKLMVLQSAQGAPAMAWTWGVVLAASFIIVIGCVRAGSLLFWSTSAPPAPVADAVAPRGAEWLPAAALLGCCLLMVVFAAPLQRYTDATAAQLGTREAYVQAVLGSTAPRAPLPLPAGSPP